MSLMEILDNLNIYKYFWPHCGRFEVETRLRLIPTRDDFEKINTEIIYSAIIELDGDIDDKKKLEEIILIKVPNDIYPNIRSLFVSLFEESGFKDIKIDEVVNFRELYNKKRVQ